MSNTQKTIYVYENWSSEQPLFLGTLYADYTKGKEVFSFSFDTQWIETNPGRMLDPDLAPYSGRQYTPMDKSIFGMFADSCPDRWGRVLMKRREAIQARKEDRKPAKLQESDFLLGVYDESRMGALHFCTEKGGSFLSDNTELATPPWANLRELEEASRLFEQDENALKETWLKQLIGPGSSLGGARPKANVLGLDNSLWIAKFPSKSDETNTGAWEMVAHELAKLCGLNVPEAKIKRFSKLGDTFLVKRFDRQGNRRIHFASAMTMLGMNDGASGADGIGYLDIAAFITASGANPKEDLAELWKRIVFHIAISNTDDHLRNHGFLLQKNGWVLSPLFDVNPVPYGDTLSLNISENDNTIAIENALSVAEYFHLAPQQAEQYAESILKAVNDNWKSVAEKLGISRNEIEMMRPAFTVAKSGF